RRVLSRSRIFQGIGGLNRLALRQFDAERRAVAFLAGHADGAVMVADDGLHDGEAQPSALILGGVVRGKKARARFRREALAGIADFDAHLSLMFGGSQRERAS